MAAGSTIALARLARDRPKGGGSDESGKFIVRGVASDRYDFARSGANPRTARGAAVDGD